VFLFLYGKKVATRQKHGHMREIFHSQFRIPKSEIEGLSSALARQNENSTIPFNPKSRIPNHRPVLCLPRRLVAPKK
jgi:hypothetical protein